MPFGAQVLENGGTRFRLWAPSAQRIDLLLQGETRAELPMRNIDGWFETVVSNVGAGTRYAYRVDGGLSVPDPASRNNPQDVHGPSEVVDPTAFDWSDVEWRGRPWEEAVIYELHVGTFTPEGTYAAAERRLDYLRDLGVTVIELMPVADFCAFAKRTPMSLQRTLYLPNSVTKFPVPAETENFLGVLTGKPAFLLSHIARSLLLGLTVPRNRLRLHATAIGAYSYIGYFIRFCNSRNP